MKNRIISSIIILAIWGFLLFTGLLPAAAELQHLEENGYHYEGVTELSTTAFIRLATTSYNDIEVLTYSDDTVTVSYDFESLENFPYLMTDEMEKRSNLATVLLIIYIVSGPGAVAFLWLHPSMREAF